VLLEFNKKAPNRSLF